MDNYKKINEIKTKLWDINLIGVVKFFRPPSLIQKTGDYQMLITLVDETVQDDIESGIRCNLFAKKEELPPIRKIGDIILLKHVRVTEFRGRLQLQKNHKYQWIVFQTAEQNGKYITGPIRSSCPPIMINPFEDIRLNELLEFLEVVLPKICEIETPETSDEITPLSEIKADKYINVLVKIIAVSGFENCDSKALLLKVSDGLKVPYNSLYQAGKSSLSFNNEISIATKEHSGFVSVFDEHVETIKRLNIGDVVLIKNLHVKAVTKEFVEQCKKNYLLPEVVDRSKWFEMIVHSGSTYGRSINLVKDERAAVVDIRIRKIVDEFIVRDILMSAINNVIGKETIISNPGRSKRKIEDEVISEDRTYQLTPPQCLQEFLTSTRFPLLNVSTIRDMEYSVEKGYKKWRLHCQALSIRPNRIIDMLQYFCKNCGQFTKPDEPLKSTVIQCGHCSDDSFLKFTYFLRLLLLDRTGLVEVVSYGDESVYFFDDVSPQRLIGDTEKLEQLQSKIDKLDKYQENIENLDSLPFVDICVLSSSKSADRFRNFLLRTSLV